MVAFDKGYYLSLRDSFRGFLGLKKNVFRALSKNSPQSMILKILGGPSIFVLGGENLCCVTASNIEGLKQTKFSIILYC